MGTKSITMYRGDTNNITIGVTDSDGIAFDLTDFTMRFTVKKKVADLDSGAYIGPLTASIPTPALGIGVVPITTTLSNIPEGTYIYDVQITNSDESLNYTVIKDYFIIIDGVTDTSD